MSPFEPVEERNKHQSGAELSIAAGQSPGYLSAGAVRQHFADVDRVKFLVDREHSRIALVPDDGEHSYSLSAKDGGASLSVRKALLQLDVDPDDLDDRYNCEVVEDDESGYVVADVRSVVEAATEDVHCPECGKRFTEQGVSSHMTKVHDETWAGKALKEADPDDIGGSVPEGDDSWREQYDERGEA